MIDLKKETASKLHDIVPESTIFQLFSIGLITEQTAKRFLIFDDYAKSQQIRGHKTEIKEGIAEKYCVSFELVQKITAKR